MMRALIASAGVGMSRSLSVGMLSLMLAVAVPAHAQPVDSARPAVGGVASLADAMIFYVARGAPGACGPGCSEWIAAEGAIQWDSHKRLLAVLGRAGERKLPLVLDVRGEANLNVAVSMGRIIRERGLDVTAGATRVAQCAGATEADCFALKRGGGPLDAGVDASAAHCDVACVLVLAGGVHRTLPAATRMIIGGRAIKNRLGLNVADERREGLQTRFGEQFRLYLTQMGISPEFMDIIDRNTEQQRGTELKPDDWTRLHIVTGGSQ
jgi:hypothetical protein